MNPRIPDRGDGAVIMAFVRKMNPIRDPERYTDEYWADLHVELRIHQRIAEIACLIGMFVGFFLPWYLTGTFQGWDIGIGFGLMVIFPLCYIFTVGLYKGLHRTLERYADYTTMMFAIPWRAQFYWIGLPALLIALICVVGRVAYPVDIRKHTNTTEQTGPANHRPFGTSGMAPAYSASRAGAMPEASGDS